MSSDESSSTVDYVDTERKKKQKLCFKGYYYYYERPSKKSKEIKFWSCEERRKNGCKARVHLKNNKVIKKINEHNHPPDGARKKKLEILSEIREKAANLNNNDPPSIIIAQSMEKTNRVVQVSMTKDTNLKRTIQRTRIKNRNIPPQPKSLQQLEIPQSYQFFENGSKFLLVDDGIGDNRMLIFGSETNLDYLNNAKDIYSDGTFDTAPPLFKQIYTIHGEIHEHVRPLLYCLLPDGCQSTYQRVFEKIKKLCPQMKPQSWMCDFEKAAMNSIEKVFEIQTIGCFFHLSQCVYRKVQSEKLIKLYRQSNGEFSLWIRCLPALAFVPPDKVIESFEQLVNHQEFPKEAKVIANYFRDSWIYGNKFPISKWNIRERTLLNKKRTNNSVEGWHRRFSYIVNNKHPQIFKLIEEIRKEQQEQNRLIERAKAGEQPKKKSKKYNDANQDILNITQKFYDRNLIEFLQGLAHKLKL